MASLTVLNQRLDEAETAMHRLATGSMVEEITGPNQTKTKFMPSDMAKLEKYVGYLKSQIAAANGRGCKPIGFTFNLG